jgi:general transcription factor 3C polypeptide 3 (transcription factor C subunit 4)
MKDTTPSSDSNRMFAALCRLSDTPVSWYSSGPSQKYLLRQIKSMDSIMKKSRRHCPGIEHDDNLGDRNNLDVCLLMLYGHILFTSTSYTHSLSKYRDNIVLSLSTIEY